MRRPVPPDFNRHKLEEAAGVDFRYDDEALAVVELVQDWYELRNDDDDIRWRDKLRQLLKLRKQARALGAQLIAPELRMYDDWLSLGLGRDIPDRRLPAARLSVYVEHIAEVWRQHGGKDRGSSYFSASANDGHHTGPLLELLLELFEQAGVPKQQRPSRHSLHNAILAVRKQRGRAPKRGRR
jgi:hypothetical protein